MFLYVWKHCLSVSYCGFTLYPDSTLFCFNNGKALKYAIKLKSTILKGKRHKTAERKWIDYKTVVDLIM